MKKRFIFLTMVAMIAACGTREVHWGNGSNGATSTDAGTTPDTAGPQFGCTSNLECNDGNPSTSDSCFGGACYHFPGFPAGGCTYDFECNDGNLGTNDQCVSGVCHHFPDYPVSGGCTFDSDCNDGNGSTFDQCLVGICHHTYDDGQSGTFGCTSNAQCNDGNAQTSDSCFGGACFHFPYFTDSGCQSDFECNDGNQNTSDQCVSGVCHFFPDYPVGGGCQSDLDCNDSNSQTYDECVSGICHHTYDDGQSGTFGCTSNAQCNDGNSSTTDSCVSGACFHFPDPPVNVGCQTDNDCDDSNAQTIDTCVGGVCHHFPDYPVSGGCQVDADCNDSNDQTNDECVGGICHYTYFETCLGLDDGDYCTDDTCVNGSAVHTPVNCQNGYVCDSANGQCVSTCVDIDDGDFCTVDTCVNGSTVHTSVNCNDGVSCTADSCQDGACVHEDACDIGEVCDQGVNQCVPSGTCQGLNDGNLCTVDTCVNGSAVHTQIDCNDGAACTTDSCQAGVCVNEDTCPTNSICDLGLGSCVTTCFDLDDNDACTKDSCVNGSAVHMPLSCNDGNSCTIDLCDSTTGCEYSAVPNGTICNDGNACSTDDICQGGACVGPEATVCDDGDPCTNDGCKALSGCFTTPRCEDGFFCNPSTTMCIPTCQSDAECDDSNVCTLDVCEGAGPGVLGLCSHEFACDSETEICDGQQCLPKVPDCTGSLPSFTDGCQEVVCKGGTWSVDQIIICEDGVCETSIASDGSITGVCASIGCTSDAQCDDGEFCNGQEVCLLNGICQAGLPPNKSDGINCTADSCDEVLDIVVNTPLHNVCNVIGQICDPSQVVEESSPGCFTPQCNFANDFGPLGEAGSDCAQYRDDAGVPADGENSLIGHYGYGCWNGICAAYEDSGKDQYSPIKEVDCDDGIDGDLDGKIDGADSDCVPCVSSCQGKTCGDDGCGGTCGGCVPGKTCSDSGMCVLEGGCITDVDCLGGQQCLLGQCIVPSIEGVRCWDGNDNGSTVPTCHEQVAYQCHSPLIWDGSSPTPACGCEDSAGNKIVTPGIFPEVVVCCVADLGWPPVCKGPAFPLP